MIGIVNHKIDQWNNYLIIKKDFMFHNNMQKNWKVDIDYQQLKKELKNIYLQIKFLKMKNILFKMERVYWILKICYLIIQN